LFGSSSDSGTGGGLFKSSSTATQVATLSLLDQIDAWYQTQTDATNPFLPNLYNGNNNCVQINQGEAASLWADMYAASDPGFFFSGKNADLSGILTQFEQWVANACDLSYISSLCQSQTNSNLWTFMRHYFANDGTGTSGQTNMEMLADFVSWAGGLPQTGTEQ